MRFSFVVRTGFVLKPVRKLRDTAARKLNRGRKRKYSPLISRVFQFDLTRGCLSNTHVHTGYTEKNSPKNHQLRRLCEQRTIVSCLINRFSQKDNLANGNTSLLTVCCNRPSPLHSRFQCRHATLPPTSGEERCVTTLKTAVKRIIIDLKTISFLKVNKPLLLKAC